MFKFVSVCRDESHKWVSDKHELGVVFQLGLLLGKEKEHKNPLILF